MHALNIQQVGYGVRCRIKNGYDWTYICRPRGESERPVLPRICYVLLSQQMLPAIKRVAGDTFVFQQDSAPAHRTLDTIQLLQQETPDFIGPDLWPPNSPDLNPVDYKIWGVVQQTVIDLAVSQWRQQLRTFVHAQGRHFEHLLWACLTDTWIERT